MACVRAQRARRAKRAPACVPPPPRAGEGGLLVDQRFLPRIVEGEVRVLMIYDAPVVVVHKRPAEGAFSATLFSGARRGPPRPRALGRGRQRAAHCSSAPRPQKERAAAGGAALRTLNRVRPTRARARRPRRYTYDDAADPKWAPLIARWASELPQARGRGPRRARRPAPAAPGTRGSVPASRTTPTGTPPTPAPPPQLRELLGGPCGGPDFPLLWTADFILDDGEGGRDAYRRARARARAGGAGGGGRAWAGGRGAGARPARPAPGRGLGGRSVPAQPPPTRTPTPSPPPPAPPPRLGELNASCVGFTTHPQLAGDVADAIIGVVTAAKARAAAAAAAGGAAHAPAALAAAAAAVADAVAAAQQLHAAEAGAAAAAGGAFGEGELGEAEAAFVQGGPDVLAFA